MSLRFTFLLMIVFMVLGSFALFDPFQWKEKKEKAAERESRVVWLKNKKLETISFKGPTSLLLVCAEKGGCLLDGGADWRIEAPVQDKADAAAVAAFANGLANLAYSEKIDFEGGARVDPKEFGLDGRRAVTVKPAGEPAFTIELGGPSPVGPNIYVRKEPERLYIVGSHFAQAFDKDLFHWRNKRLFPRVDTAKISSLRWKGKVSVAAEKKDGAWRLSQPVAAAGNFTMFEGLASTLAYAGAKAVLDKGEGRAAALLIEFNDGAPQRLSLAPRAKSLTPGVKEYLARVNETGPYFAVEAAPFDRFLKPLLEYRERTLGGRPEAATELHLKFPRENKAVTLKKVGEDWTYGEAEPLSQERVKALLAALAKAEATAFLPVSGPEGKQFATRPKDVELSWGETRASFFVWDRKLAITEGELPTEVRAYGQDLLRVLPVRLQDLAAANNKVVISEPKEDEHEHEHSHDEHRH